MDFAARAQALKEELVETRRHLHRNPELSMDLPETTAFVAQKLRDLGCESRELPHGGLTALIGGKRPGRTVLLRADMDALPMKEESGLPFASRKEGAAHTCGHDLHTACLLGAARLLKEREEDLSGTVKLMFQPGEETLLGAKSMIADGVLEAPAVDAAVMLHMAPMVPAGTLILGSGVVAASSDPFTITVTGKGGHGAMPHLAVDPINAAAHIHLALQELISRETDSLNTAVLTIGTFHAGTAENIIPTQAVMTGTLRTYDKAVREALLPRIREIVELTSRAFRAQGTLRIDASVLPLVADKAAVDTVAGAFRTAFGEERVLIRNQPLCGSEDFAEIADRVPSLRFLLGGGSPEEGCRYNIHHPKIVYQEDCLPTGAAAYAVAALALLEG